MNQINTTRFASILKQGARIDRSSGGPKACRESHCRSEGSTRPEYCSRAAKNPNSNRSNLRSKATSRNGNPQQEEKYCYRLGQSPYNLFFHLV